MARNINQEVRPLLVRLDSRSGEPLAKLLSLDFLHQSPQISQDEIEHAVLDAIDASEEVPYGILAQNAAF